MTRSLIRTGAALWLFALFTLPVLAQDEEKPDLGWSNTTELSFVATDGNSETQTWGFKNLLQKRMTASRFRLRLESVRAESADDRFAVVDPATPLPLPQDELPDFIVVTPDPDTDVDNSLVEARYDRNISERFFWHVGGGWDRNKDAGIDGRYQVFAGVGNIWWDRDDLAFQTAYGFSYTDTDYETPDPTLDDSYPGVRFEWNYFNRFGATTEYRNDWSINANLEDLGDYRYDMVNSVRVKMTDHLALQVSLQWLYNSRPALDDIDVKLFLDENGIPVYPCTSQCSETVLGTAQIRKKKLDTIFNTSLVVSF